MIAASVMLSDQAILLYCSDYSGVAATRPNECSRKANLELFAFSSAGTRTQDPICHLRKDQLFAC